MNSNKVVLTLLAACGFSVASAQTDAKAIKWNEANPQQIQIVDVNPSDQLYEKVLNTITLTSNRRYVANTLHHDKKSDLLYFFTDVTFANQGGIFQTNGQQKLIVAQASTGERLRELPFFNSAVMSPFIIGEKNELGFISSQSEFKGYGNNDDDISLVLFNLNTGEISHKVELPTLSFQNLSAPFVGKREVRSKLTGMPVDVEVSLSSPCYMSGANKLVFVAKDVMGINRLFKVNTRTGKLESQLSIAYDVLDMVYDADAETIRTLYIEEEAGQRFLKLGNLDVNMNEITDGVVVRALTSSEESIEDGFVEVDAATGDVFVGKLVNKTQVMYTYTSDLTLVEQVARKNQDEKVDFEFPTEYKSTGFGGLNDVVKMYPNPASDMVTIETTDVTTVTEVIVMNSVGEVVKRVDVQSGAMLNDITVDNLTPGMYFVQIESDGAEAVNRKLIVK